MTNIFPSDWANFTLNKICFFQEGPGLRNWQYKQNGIKFINIRCINNGYLDLSNAQFLSLNEVDFLFKPKIGLF